MLRLVATMPGTNVLRIVCLSLPLIAAPTARAGEPLSTGPDCGPDAFSSAQVIEGRPPRRGPLTAMPDTLCTDLTPQQPQPRIDIYAYPSLGAPAGAPGAGVPYEGRPQRYLPSR
ncbi:hypothetical protein H0176_12120 [Methylorubrum populi]|jgi:hypothetical protein|uniref:Uncharacterized protein n=1 Tax=Methylorubrum rhodesianum TaxID=29427 RepID=A0ABU9ZIY1_9HYPH|nr:hypothetical protein [Methylorubrum rhodesianum]MBK3401382.1 hypothetical protein [Methylorubrum rhodesianum]MBY0141016.1 hypothetical protein [Methylorubrum populi]